MMPVNQRKPKKPVPEHAKDKKYYINRIKNTKTAAISRQKKRDADFQFKQLLFDEEEKNKQLKQQVIDLKEQLSILVHLYKLKHYNDTLFFNSIITNNLIYSS